MEAAQPEEDTMIWNRAKRVAEWMLIIGIFFSVAGGHWEAAIFNLLMLVYLEQRRTQ